MKNREMRRPGLVLAAAFLALGSVVQAQAPAEVTGVTAPNKDTLAWSPSPDAEEYFVYAGPLSTVKEGALLHCFGDQVGDPFYQMEAVPESGRGFFYIVNGWADPLEGTPGLDTSGSERFLGGTCDTALRDYTLDRVGFGWDEWSRDRIALFGLQGYIEEQLNPVLIDESTNTALQDRRIGIDPPSTIQNLQALDMVNAVYSRRQLEQQVALFWSNHFSTDYRESFRLFFRYNNDVERKRREAITLHYDELEAFRARAFAGSFREILEDSALSRAMIRYLDTDNNVVGKPNENYARELLELHTMGVDGGYTHHEINEMARVMTGWNVCKKTPANAGDYLTGCIAYSLIGTVLEPDGLWVTNFRQGQHDCGEKILFSGTPYETFIPDTCANPADGVNDLFLALDVIADHPSTSHFIVTKLLQRFVTDTPAPDMIDAVLTVWNDTANPYGKGDLQQVLGAVLGQLNTLDAGSLARSTKLKTPFEQVASGLRAVRGKTNGQSFVRGYLLRLQHLLHQNPVPTGYPEVGLPWIDTNGILERQNFASDLARRTGVNFGNDIIALLQDNGVSTTPGHAVEIVDFFIDALYGGVFSAEGRQAAIDYLNTDDIGVPATYNNARIRETVGILMGFPEFFEQ